MANKLRLAGLTLGAVAGAAAVIKAREIAYAPADPDLEERAHEIQTSGDWQHHFAEVNGVRLHYAEMGEGPLVILIHGFPQCWYEWHKVGPLLAEKYHVVALDQRGYNLSDKPEGVQQYSLDKLSQDIASLITALGEQKAHVVGHDWGGAVAWQVGIDHADRVNKLVVINAPHLSAMQRELMRGKQLLRSYYVYLFQLPLFPEAVIRSTICSALANSTAEPGVFDDEALDVYENNVSQPGAATAMINYYRATVRNTVKAMGKVEQTQVRVPTMLLWGMQDFALVPELTENLEQWVPDLRVYRNPDSNHWVPEEAPEWVAEKLIEFFA